MVWARAGDSRVSPMWRLREVVACANGRVGRGTLRSIRLEFNLDASRRAVLVETAGEPAIVVEEETGAGLELVAHADPHQCALATEPWSHHREGRGRGTCELRCQGLALVQELMLPARSHFRHQRAVTAEIDPRRGTQSDRG